jgi:uncharacterized protein (DUF1778 family)
MQLKLSKRDFKVFIDALENPPAPNDKLLRAAKHHERLVDPSK